MPLTLPSGHSSTRQSKDETKMPNGLTAFGPSAVLGTLKTKEPTGRSVARLRLGYGSRTFRNRQFYNGFAHTFTCWFGRELRLAPST